MIKIPKVLKLNIFIKPSTLIINNSNGIPALSSNDQHMLSCSNASKRIAQPLNQNHLYHSTTMPLKAKIGPSILNADLVDLYAESQKLLDNGADYLHLDVMDGHFVPNLTFGHPVVKCLRNKIKDAFFETHMMVSNPGQWIEPMADAGVNLYTFHIEPVKDIVEVCRKVRESGMQVGLALKPGTPVEDVVKYVDDADLVLVMTVEPGFGGQSFMADMMPKVEWLRKNYPTLDIEVDGGVGPKTIDCCAKAGANVIVSGTAVIKSDDQKQVIDSLKKCVQSYIN